ncbi:MAG: 1,4-alpha-glucan branching enzyme, partial [Synergistaceae bacterium]|nr:1,4-alpha-glucan branching enzyme [Synergistaceae bacterium]
GSMLGKMPGDAWQQFANLRLLYGFMYAHPGKKLLFMGSEFAQGKEWNHDDSLQWDQLNIPEHRGVSLLVGELNRIYREEPALHELDFTSGGFEWCDFSDWEKSVVAFVRKSRSGDMVMAVCNFTPLPRLHYRIPVPRSGYWRELLNTDAREYGGGGFGNFGGLYSVKLKWKQWDNSLCVTLPPLGMLLLKLEQEE